MQRIFTLFIFSILTSTLFSQTRYKDEVFSIIKHADIPYGSNFDSKNQLTTLLMDIYEPQNDTAYCASGYIFCAWWFFYRW
jgi:hypothetical protein